MQTHNFNPVNARNWLVNGDGAVHGTLSVFSDRVRRLAPCGHFLPCPIPLPLPRKPAPFRRRARTGQTGRLPSDFPDSNQSGPRTINWLTKQPFFFNPAFRTSRAVAAAGNGPLPAGLRRDAGRGGKVSDLHNPCHHDAADVSILHNAPGRRPRPANPPGLG